MPLLLKEKTPNNFLFQKMDEEIKGRILNFQKNEITEFCIYDKLSQWLKYTPNKEVLNRIAQEELSHYNILKGYTKQEVNPSKFKIGFLIRNFLGADA